MNQMRLDSFCSNEGEGYCIKFLDSKMAKNVKPQILGYLGGQNPIKVGLKSKQCESVNSRKGVM